MNQNALVDQTIRIAVADDHPILRQGVCSLINTLKNCQVVVEADNGKDLLDKLSGQDQLPDLCILDINMPVMNGYDTLIALKAKWPGLKVIMLTMLDDDYTILRVLQDGANGFLLKGCGGDDFLKAITTVYKDGYFFSGLISDETIRIAAKLSLPSISERQMEYLRLCASDMNYGKIAGKMGISVRTVEGIQKALGEKLNIHSRVGLAVFAVKTGIATRDK